MVVKADFTVHVYVIIAKKSMYTCTIYIIVSYKVNMFKISAEKRPCICRTVV